MGILVEYFNSSGLIFLSHMGKLRTPSSRSSAMSDLVADGKDIRVEGGGVTRAPEHCRGCSVVTERKKKAPSAKKKSKNA